MTTYLRSVPLQAVHHPTELLITTLPAVTSWIQLHTVIVIVALALIPGFAILFHLLSNTHTKHNYPIKSKITPEVDVQHLSTKAPDLKLKLSRAIEVSHQLNEVFGMKGQEVSLHTPKGSRLVNISSCGSELRWEYVQATGMMKKYKLDVKDVLFVEIGKRTKNLQNKLVDDEKCLSLVSRFGTLDFEVEKDVRDVLACTFHRCLKSLADITA